MPIQAPQWTDYLNCPVCCREFGPPPRSPVSLGCGHTLCRHCLKNLHKKQCPFDQTAIQVDLKDLVTNTAILQLAGYPPPPQPYHPPCIQALPDQDKHAYDVIVKCLENLALYLKYCGTGTGSNGVSTSRLSRPMQRKLITVLQCAMTDEEGRGRAARAVRSLGERTVTELILQHQNPQQLSANLWAAVRARGCQFLGPAMQEEVLKLVLLALEDGSALSRKVLVMFVVQRLEPHFPQASKTSIGHVVQLLYRASCFKVSKRESDSSLMQLKEEFRSYESLRREHDAQIVQIATEAGLRIAPDQWSSLLYGDTAHKSHMQSIIDKLQTPASFGQSVQELFIALQRSGEPAELIVLSLHLDRLATIEPTPDPHITYQQLAEIMTSLNEVLARFADFFEKPHDINHNANHAPKLDLNMRVSPGTVGAVHPQNRFPLMPNPPPLMVGYNMMPGLARPLPPPPMFQFPGPPRPCPVTVVSHPPLSPNMIPHPERLANAGYENIQIQPNMLRSPPPVMLPPPGFPGVVAEGAHEHFYPQYVPAQYQPATGPSHFPTESNRAAVCAPAVLPPGLPVIYKDVNNGAPYEFSGKPQQERLPVFEMNMGPRPALSVEQPPGSVWSASNNNNVYEFSEMNEALPHPNNDMFVSPSSQPTLGAEWSEGAKTDDVADHELEEELLALKRRIDTEF